MIETVAEAAQPAFQTTPPSTNPLCDFGELAQDLV